MICSKCGYVMPEGTTECPRCARQNSLVHDMDLELKQLLQQDDETKAGEQTIVAGASIQAAVNAAFSEKKASIAEAADNASAVDRSQKKQHTETGSSHSSHSEGHHSSHSEGHHSSHSSSHSEGHHSSHGSGHSSSHSSQQKRSGPLTILIAVIIIVVLVGATIGGISGYAMKYAKYDKILPNVYIAGIDVSGLTVDEAITVVEQSMKDYEQKSVEVQLPDQVLTFTPDQNAVVMNPEAAVSAAYNYGRGKSSPFALARAIRAAEKTENNIDISTAVTVDTDAIYQLVKETAAAVNEPKVETSIEADKELNQITVSIGTEGKILDAAELYNLVCNAFVTGDYSTITFDYTIDYPETVTLDSVYEMMTVEPQNAKYDPKTKKITEAEDGILPETALEDANTQIAAAEQGSELVFKFSTAKADYDAATLKKLLFRDELDTTASEVVGSERLSNIEAACEALEGTVVQPGSTFSFNKALGTVGYAGGYVSAAVYPGDASGSVMGGGISQVASALYECCMYADLQIAERHAHKYLPSFASAGLDAYVENGTADFQFVNSSEYPVQIHAAVSGQTLTVYLEGTDVNSYEIQLDAEKVNEDPYETDDDADVIGFDGAEYHVTRTVLDQDGKEVRKDSTEDLDAMAGCGTTVYERRDGSDYTESETTTETTADTATDDTDTNSNTSGNTTGGNQYYNYTTPQPSITTTPTDDDTTGGDTTGGETTGGDTTGGDTTGGDTTGGDTTGGDTTGGDTTGGDTTGGGTTGGDTTGGDTSGSGGATVIPIE